MIGGSGNDTYAVDSIDDVVTELASEGTDVVNAFIDYTLPANVENLSLFGSAINGTGNSLGNLMFGNDLNNSLLGGDGDDLIFGDAQIAGIGGDDYLDGGNGSDNLYGGRGNDTMVGGAGFDFFYHDEGGDVMTGGTGPDWFLFQSVDDLGGATVDLADRITDFNQSEFDKIQLRFLDANTTAPGIQAFQWLGTDPLGGTTDGRGALWYANVSGNTHVFGDYTADGVADFMIVLNGTITLTASDFILG
jgi:Ca2+-binding RTX toxin-like protein